MYTAIAFRFLRFLGVVLEPHPNPSNIIRRAPSDSKCNHQVVPNVTKLESSAKAVPQSLHCQLLFVILEDLLYSCGFDIYQKACSWFLLSRAAGELWCCPTVRGASVLRALFGVRAGCPQQSHGQNSHSAALKSTGN